MGLSIHYKGKLKELTFVRSLIDEVVVVCNGLKWKYQEFNEKGIIGIVFSPDNCEPLFFTFDVNGQLISPVYRELGINPSNTISVKTQFAGIHSHLAIIKLIKHLSEKYFDQFELFDEGGYWETGDIKVLQDRFGEFEIAFDILEKALRKLESPDNETSAS